MLKIWIVLAVAATSATISASRAEEPREGIWAESLKPPACEVPLLVMSQKTTSDDYDYYRQFAEVALDQIHGQVVGGEREGPFVCYITQITNIDDANAWIFDLSCGGEGDTWSRRGIVMRTPVVMWGSDGLREQADAIATYNMTHMDIGGEVMQLYRCPK